MLRPLAFLLALTLPAAAQVADPATTGSLPRIVPTVPIHLAPTLKSSVTVMSDVVRIGDLIEHAGAAATIPIFRSPDLGDTGAVPAERVIEAVRPYELGEIDTAGLNEIAVTRASRAITPKEIAARIARAFAHKHGFGEAANLNIVFDREIATVHVEPTGTGEIGFARLSFDPRSARFDAMLDIPGSAVARRLPLRFTGVVIETVETATLTRPVNRGDTLHASDLAIERRPKAEAGTDFVATLAAAVGLAARRSLRPGVALRAADLMKPQYVQRNDTVTIVYEAPGIIVTMRGKAQDSGVEGDTVSVVNVQSNRVLQGTVIGPGRVSVISTAARLVANAAPPAHVATALPARR